jgi:purine-binding chemotaxis protein CheW
MTTNATMTEELDIIEEVEPDQYLVFNVKSQEFAFQAMRIQEISRVLPITEVPNAPSYIDGVTNLRGRLATVMSFRSKFGFERRKHDEDTRAIVIELGGSPVGIIVDSVEEVVRIPDEMVQAMPTSTVGRAIKEYMKGVGMLDNRLIVLLDVDKVLTETELVNLREITQAIGKPEVPEQSPEVPEQSTVDKSIDAVPQPAMKPQTAKRRKK